jgi:hypothetical protein
MNYCILRLEKLPALDEVERSAKHTFREIPTKNADPARTHMNKTWGAQTSAHVLAAIEAKLPAKRRKDAVSCIEYMITASPEFFKTAPIKTQNDSTGLLSGLKHAMAQTTWFALTCSSMRQVLT